jgi:hypothetical protein
MREIWLNLSVIFSLFMFLAKAIPTLDSYCLSTKMKILNNFTPKYYKPNQFICKEGQKPNEIMVIFEGQ